MTLKKLITSMPSVQEIFKEVLRQKENYTRRKLDLYKGMKSTRNGNYLGTLIRILLMVLMV